MTIEVTQPGIESEAAVEAELRDLGLHFLKFEVPAVDNASHWHSFSSVFYVNEGTLLLTDVETGQVHHAGPGSRVSVPERTLHAERSDGYSILLGTSRDPATFEDPVNLAADELVRG
ncbi:MAG: cupin domain-containing protein [Gammaproteobacteria bacterium]|nr:cupin domain-containing protein [Gammaproteobacteria bacterium]